MVAHGTKNKQLETIIPHSIEEVYEVAEQVYLIKIMKNLQEELGDLLFQVGLSFTNSFKEKNKFELQRC